MACPSAHDLARSRLRLRRDARAPRRARDPRRGHREEAQAWLDRTDAASADGAPLASRADELVALELRRSAQKQRSEDGSSARAAGARGRLHHHSEVDRLEKSLGAGPFSYPLSLLAQRGGI